MADIEKTAVISECRRYRYRLGRRWSDRPLLVFVMLNPSTADAAVDDPTIRRCIHFAKAHDFGGIDVVNLYAFRATHPRDLKSAAYPIGSENDWHIRNAARRGSAVCLAWGAFVANVADDRPEAVLRILRDLGIQPQCLHITRSGYPGHPLMLPNTARLAPFDLNAIDEAMHG